jgi:hypothetical protein
MIGPLVICQGGNARLQNILLYHHEKLTGTRIGPFGSPTGNIGWFFSATAAANTGDGLSIVLIVNRYGGQPKKN